MSIPSWFLTPHNQVSSDFVRSLRAFGVRIRHTGSSRINPCDSETLSLYVNDGSRLRQIMSSLVVSENHGEWDGFCAGDFGETKRTLAVGKPGTDGFASLRVTEVSTGSRSVLKGDEECEDIPSDSKTTMFSLAYAGSRYEVPKTRRGLDQGMDGG